MSALPPRTGAEQARLAEACALDAPWRLWGPYLPDRQWGTVREDYSSDGRCWDYFPHDHAPLRAYRWGEDGLLGFCDAQARVALAPALWNGRDPILKERLFGLAGPEGNHGEDVKEAYFFLDGTPTHSYHAALYKYPHAAFPYDQLRAENARRTRREPEYELADTGIFDGERYTDVLVEYAKAAPDDVLLRLTLTNRGPETVPVHVLPTLWCRNTWGWGRTGEHFHPRPVIRRAGPGTLRLEHAALGAYRLHLGLPEDLPLPDLLFTGNETNYERLYGVPGPERWTKDAFHRRVVAGDAAAVHPDEGTKAAAWYVLRLAAGESRELRIRWHAEARAPREPLGEGFAAVMAARAAEAADWHRSLDPPAATPEERQVLRQARAGLLWSKKFYYYDVRDWLAGDPAHPPPPAERRAGRNRDWAHLNNADLIAMPDAWEYPWYAAWDLAFHAVALAELDPEFAKGQLVLLLREWYLHPNGQLPAYEFAFGDVNPPVHAWAAWRVYKMTGARGHRDRGFLARVFQKLLLNFTWWVNRKDVHGEHLFSGGFLGLDNIGVFDRSRPLPGGGHLEQADGTAWMAFYSITMLAMALELEDGTPAYEDMATKFFEHFVAIADAMNTLGGSGLWDDADGFYYDQLHAHGQPQRLRLRSMVGLIPLLACEVLEDDVLARRPAFAQRMQWFLENRGEHGRGISLCLPGQGARAGRRLLALPTRERLVRVLRYLLDPEEFLSPHGLRSLSRAYHAHPYEVRVNGEHFTVRYAPGESTTALFGGNSNWRGPIWIPLNYLLIEALERYHHFTGDALRVELPTGSGRWLTLQEVALELCRRLTTLFLPDPAGHRPCHGEHGPDRGPAWRDLILFHEYFDGDTGRGLGASHQTGWTALVARCLETLARSRGAAPHRVGPG